MSSISSSFATEVTPSYELATRSQLLGPMHLLLHSLGGAGSQGPPSLQANGHNPVSQATSSIQGANAGGIASFNLQDIIGGSSNRGGFGGQHQQQQVGSQASTAQPGSSVGHPITLSLPTALGGACTSGSLPSPGAGAMQTGQGSSQGSSTNDIPASIFFHFPLCKNTPPARWAHTATVVGDSLLVFGGVGSTVLDDLCLLDCATMNWRQLTTQAARAKDRPEKMLGHAAAASGNKVWFFGGQQGRKFLRALYSFDLDTSTWTKHPSDPLPPARAGHAMVTVHGSSVYMFGGQGKKLYNELYKLDPAAGTFQEIEATGKAPSPRRGHSLVWDGRDSLVCFGGINASTADNHLALFSLSRSEWVNPQTFGPCPSPRTQHSAVTLSPGIIMFFGGCSATGTFFNDVHVLDTRTLTWHKPQCLNTSPAPRYHHTCNLVQGKILLYGGINSKQTFEGVVVMETKFHQDLSFVAEELFKMSAERGSIAPSSPLAGRMTAAAAAATELTGTASIITGGDSNTTLDSFKAQLTDLLVKRNMEELHQQASRKAETVESQLAEEKQAKEGLQRELLQIKLLLSEAEGDRSRAQAAAEEASAKASKAATEVAQMRAELAALRSKLTSKEDELAEARTVQEGLLRELGILASRCSRITARGEEDGSSGAGGPSSARRAASSQSQSQSQQQQHRVSGGSASASRLVVNVVDRQGASLQGGAASATTTTNGQATDMINSNTQSAYESVLTMTSALDDVMVGDLNMMNMGSPYPSGAPESAGGPSNSGGGSGNSGLGARGGLGLSDPTVTASAIGRAVLLDGHPNAQLSALSAQSLVLSNPASAGSSRTQHLMQSQQSQQQSGMQALVSRLSTAEQQRAAAVEESQSLAERVKALEEANKSMAATLSRLSGDACALEGLGMEALQGLEDRLEQSARTVREAIMQRKIVEQVQRRAAVASSEANQCGVCMEAARGIVFNCGHQSCADCSSKFTACPFCRVTITTKIKLFDA